MPDRRFLLVDAAVLPEVFLKVLQAKELLASGAVTNISTAARQAGISRSAFYKYREAVFPYESGGAQRLASLTVTLLDEPGVLCALLGELYRLGANIVTVSQNPTGDGVALVFLTARVARETPDGQLVTALGRLPGVVEARATAGD